jgi:N-acetylglutamate synthase-like GNAT family acetyltransferase
MINYRLATEEDYQRINDFHNRIYESKRTIEQFYWEFHNGPFGKSIYVIAEDEDKIVGTNCVIPIELVGSDDQIILSGKSEDTLVDPDYRGRKTFYNIYNFLFEKCKENGIKVIWGFTSAKGPFKKLGFSIPFDHLQSIAVNNVFRSYKYISSLNKSNSSIEKLKIFGLCFYSKIRLIGKSNTQISNQFDISEEKEIAQGVDHLIHSNVCSLKSSIAINQNSKFQNWRIYQNPNYHKIHTFGFYDRNNLLKGLIVLNSNPAEVAYVCQTTFHSEISDHQAVQMIKYVTKKMFKKGIALIRNWQFDHNPLNKLEIIRYNKANHTHLKRGIGFVWKELNSIEIEPEMFYLSRISTQGII